MLLFAKNHVAVPPTYLSQNPVTIELAPQHDQTQTISATFQNLHKKKSKPLYHVLRPLWCVLGQAGANTIVGAK
jgi:hypothetical protein